MNTGWLRYGAGAVLAVAAAGLLVSSGMAPAASSGSISVRPRANLTTCRSLASVRARGQVMNAGECIGTLGGPARGTETYRAGSPGRAALVPDAQGCLAGHHLEGREATRSCPVTAVGAGP